MTRTALFNAAARVVMEYESHGGRGTHQRCMPGTGCRMAEEIKALRLELERVAKPGTKARRGLTWPVYGSGSRR